MSFPYQPTVKPAPYGAHVPYNKGYDAWSRRNAPTPEKSGGASGYFLRANGAKIELWITDVTADFSLSGQYAQSHRIREFFPRSFNDVTLTITGNVASSQEYNRLALFVREHQWEALRAIEQGQVHQNSQTITFALFDNTPPAWHGQTRTSDVIWSGNTAIKSRGNSVKGRHRPWVVQGYVKSMPAGATALEIAPPFVIEFIVAYSTLTANTGLWGDVASQPTVLKSILQLIGEARQAPGRFVTDPYPTPVSNPSAPATGVGHGLWSISTVGLGGRH